MKAPRNNAVNCWSQITKKLKGLLKSAITSGSLTLAYQTEAALWLKTKKALKGPDLLLHRPDTRGLTGDRGAMEGLQKELNWQRWFDNCQVGRLFMKKESKAIKSRPIIANINKNNNITEDIKVQGKIAVCQEQKQMSVHKTVWRYG